MTNETSVSQEQIALEQQRFITKVFGWMAMGLAVTGITANITAQITGLTKFIFDSEFHFLALFLSEVLLVMILMRFLNRLSFFIAVLMFLIYSILNGLCCSVIFFAFTKESLAPAFIITCGIFILMSTYGFFTNKDLTRISNLLYILLIGVIIASIINFYMSSDLVYWITSYVDLFTFIGLVAYDTRELKEMAIDTYEDGVQQKSKNAIVGAMKLYLDFINIFLTIGGIFGEE